MIFFPIAAREKAVSVHQLSVFKSRFVNKLPTFQIKTETKYSNLALAKANVDRFYFLITNPYLKGHYGPLNDIDAFLHLVFIDDERRGQADDVTVGGLGQ